MKIYVTLDVSEKDVLAVSGLDGLDDAISSELGWLRDSGMSVDAWSYDDTQKLLPNGQRNDGVLVEVFELVCTHETRFGTDVYTSVHPSRDAAEAYVEIEKSESGYGEFGGVDGGDEEFNWEIKSHVIDVSKFNPVKDSLSDKIQVASSRVSASLGNSYNEISEPER